MFYIDYVKNVKATNIMGEPVYLTDDNGRQTKEQQVLKHLDFMLGRIVDPTFVKDKDQIEATELICSTRSSLREQQEEAEERGYWEIEDEAAVRLLNATKKPEGKFILQLQHNFLDFMTSIKDMSKKTPQQREEARAKKAAKAAEAEKEKQQPQQPQAEAAGN